MRASDRRSYANTCESDEATRHSPHIMREGANFRISYVEAAFRPIKTLKNAVRFRPKAST